MPDKITIITKKTWRDHAKQLAAIGITVVGVYGGMLVMNNYFQTQKFEKNTEIVREAWKSGNYDLAQRLINDFKEKDLIGDSEEAQLRVEVEKILKIYHDSTEATVRTSINSGELVEAKELLEEYSAKGKLRSEDEIFLRASLERALKQEETLAGFEEALKKADLENAQTIKKGLDKNLFSQEDLDKLEERIQSKTQYGFKKQIQTALDKEKIVLVQEYLTAYPEGRYKQELLEELVTKQISYFRQDLDCCWSFETMYPEFKLTNLVLELCKSQNFNFSFNAEELLEASHLYFKKAEGNDVSGGKLNLEIGSMIRIKYSPTEPSSLNENYVKERNNLIPLGSTVEIMEFIPVDVEFRLGVGYKTVKDGNPFLQYGQYDKSELETLSGVLSEEQKTQLKEQVLLLERNLKTDTENTWGEQPR